MNTNAPQRTIEVNYAIVKEGDLYCLHRNERQLMTPAGNPYSMPQEALAIAIRDEWDAQGDKIIPATMPLTQLMATALDLITKDKEKTQKGLAAYIPTELLCYRSEKPEKLVEKQKTIWKLYLDWCEETYGVQYKFGASVVPIAQEDKTTEKMTTAINAYDVMHLSALSSAVDCTGSLVLGLALIEGFKPAADIFEACELDINDQAERWGKDSVTTERQKNMIFDLEACERWVGLLRG